MWFYCVPGVSTFSRLSEDMAVMAGFTLISEYPKIGESRGPLLSIATGEFPADIKESPMV